MLTGLFRSMNGLLYASLGQRQTMTLASVAFGVESYGFIKFKRYRNTITLMPDITSSW